MTITGTKVRKPKYHAYNLHNYLEIPQVKKLPPEYREAIEIVGNVLPFKTNNYVIDHLIDWKRVPDDPMFVLTFPQKDMLMPGPFDEMAHALTQPRETIRATANRIRLTLNPHPAGQLDHNVPLLNGERLHGMQHKYRETILFFPGNGQTCHAYCSFCFRWPQFVGMHDLKFASRESQKLIEYLQAHPEINDVLFTGGDPMIMKVNHLKEYIEPLLNSNLPSLKRIRIGTKALSYWPYRFFQDDDSKELLKLFRSVTKAGKHLAIMAHFNHPVELSTPAVRRAIKALRGVGAEIRTQSPILRNINDDADAWATMWNEQVNLGCIPYYMFVVRDTGAQHFFGISLVKAWQLFRDAYQRVSGLSRTVRGPSLSTNPGKVQILGVSEIRGEKAITMRFLQGRNPDWVQRPFFAKYDEQATWLNELRPFDGEKFFFEDELERFYRENLNTPTSEDFE